MVISTISQRTFNDYCNMGCNYSVFYHFCSSRNQADKLFFKNRQRKIVQIVAGPINKVEHLVRSINKDIPQNITIQDYIVKKVAGILNINLIQNFIGSLIGILGNVIIAIFSITFITFFFLKDHRLFFESILMWVP